MVSELFLGKDSSFPQPRKYRLDYFPSHVDLGCTSAQYVGSENNRRYFLILTSENKVFLPFLKKEQITTPQLRLKTEYWLSAQHLSGSQETLKGCRQQ